MKQYEKSITSQWGEDGVLEEIFRRIGTTNKIAVDIGAWDGKHFSNTWNLAANHSWMRILVEKDRERIENYEPLPKDHSVIQECKDIDKLLDFHGNILPDLLCIDIDGDDYYLWNDTKKYRPRVVVIEYNQTVPPDTKIIQGRGGSFGASWLALKELGMWKDYILVHTTITNMIFVDVSEYKRTLKLWGNYTSKMPADWLCNIVTGYNGKRYVIGTPAHNDDQGGTHEKLITDVKLTEI